MTCNNRGRATVCNLKIKQSGVPEFLLIVFSLNLCHTKWVCLAASCDVIVFYFIIFW